MLTKALFALFVLSLPACYWSITPSILLSALFWMSYCQANESPKVDQLELSELQETMAELKSQVNALNLRAGLNLK